MSEEPSKRLLLLDGLALTYRAHFAMVRSPRFTSAGLCTSAIFGMLNTLMDIIKRQEPTHIVAAFDTKEPTERHIVFPEYKAQRDAMPEDISVQLPYIDRLLEAYNIQSVRLPGYEADDIIGTLAHQASAIGFDSLMVTPDKDYDQLVTESVKIMKPGRKGGEIEINGVAEVLDKWEIERVEQVIDILGLMGDASDNIPGVPGIGPKTAQKLIAKFGSIENLLQQTAQLKGKQRERMEENADKALLSKRLVTIQLDVPHTCDIESFAWNSYDKAKLQKLLEELEFDTIGKRLFGKSFSSAATRTAVVREKREKEIQATLFDDVPDLGSIKTVDHQYHIVRTAAERAKLIKELASVSELCFDTETTGLNPRTATPLGLALAWKPHEAYYVVMPQALPEIRQVLDEFRGVLEDDSVTKIGHNLKYDLSVLKWNGVSVCGPLFDTMLAHSMKEPEMNHGLDYLAKLYLNYEPIATTTLIGPRGPDQKSMRDVPLDKLAEYAAEDADITLQVAAAIGPDIEKRGVSEVCYNVECPLIPVLVDMEFQGIRLDTGALDAFRLRLEEDIEQLRGSIFAAAGHEFNIDSPKQLGVVLFDELQLEKNPRKTPTGQYSTRESELERLASRHDIIAEILDYRNAVKLKSVYVDQLPASVNEQTGRIHTVYEQTWTATGRIQSSSPNLQTIPIRKRRGKEIRAAFVPRNQDYQILSADYSQIELRVMADLSGDPGMIDAFRQDLDIHTITAAKVYKVDESDVTREMRDKAKTVNFGIIYGISAFGLQQRLNIPRAEANELIANYFEKYPGVQEYIDRTIAYARKHGYVKTQTGRRRYLRDINSKSRGVATAAERLAMNSPIQGTAADILKLSMIRVHAALQREQLRTRMLLTVHDEIVFDLHKDELATAVPLVESEMSSAFDLAVPLKVETGVGDNWLEAH